MKADLPKDELRALFAALHDGTISPEDHDRLEQALTTSAEARRLWFLHSDIETGLADWAALRHAGAAEKLLPFRPAPPAPARSHWSWFPPLAAAAAVALAAIWWTHRPAAPESPSTNVAAVEPKATGVALLTRSVGAEWVDGSGFASGTILEPGPLRLKSGAVQLEFFSGAHVVLEGPAELQLVSIGEAYLRSGRLNAHVPPQARGFTVSSPHLKVVDYGTDFGLSDDGQAPPEVHVFTGQVQVTSAQLPPRPLTAGQAVRFESGALQSIPAARPRFLTEEELAHRDSVFGLQRFTSWRKSSDGLSADPATVLHFTFDEGDVLERRITDQSAGATPQSHGSLVGSTWTEGRWPGKGALQFRSEGDRVRFSAPPPLHAVTLLAWVRVESLAHAQNVLLAADSEEPGSLRWLLNRSGELRLEIARDLGRPERDWEAVNSERFLAPERFGRWVMLATTFDGKTICHYGNGQPIGTGASFTPPALHVGTAELANWHGGTRRNLTATLDEFAILSRALTPEEVRTLFLQGKP